MLFKLALIFYFIIYTSSIMAYALPPFALKNIHGEFVRTQVTDLSNFRNRITGLIYDTTTKSTCTGILIGPSDVLTAAHCVYNFQKKEWSNHLTFTPGKLSEKDLGLGTFSFTEILIQKEYLETMSEDFDFALIKLDGPIGNTIGWAGFRGLTKNELTDKHTISFSGYPGDKDFSTLWNVSCPAFIDGKILSYRCDSFSGMSGSAVFEENDSANYVIGIHVFGGKDKNGAVFIDSKNFQLINNWKNSFSYSDNTLVYLKPVN